MITSREEALRQYDESLPWQQSRDAAWKALEAVQWLLMHRAQDQGHSGATLKYEELSYQHDVIVNFLGIAIAAPSTGGDSVTGTAAAARVRRVGVTFSSSSGVG